MNSTFIQNTIGIVLVGALWGCTNPFLNSGVKRKSNSVQTESSMWRYFISMWTNIAFLIPYALNQSGSLLFWYLLGKTNMSITVPVCNGLNFIFTALMSRILGEKASLGWKSIFGIILMAIGLSICIKESV
ncbi:hypothetical protein WA158_000190 [Blastocystis sp. Blastoise]